MSQYKHRCLLPFHHIAVRPDNRVFPCCAFKWEHSPKDLNLNYPDVFNHPFLKQLRESMVKDEYVEGCSSCYKHEQLSDGTQSVRLHFSEELGFDIPSEPVLTHLDLALSNVCNNRCRMCNPGLSTNWYSDAIKLGQDFFGENLMAKQLSGVKYSKQLYDQYDFKNLRHIKLIGGEPLMEEKKFIDILNKCDLPNLKIFLTTNTTIIPSKELHELLKKCRDVSVNLSVDAYGTLNNFLRKGSQWDNVVKVIDWFSENYPKKSKIYGIINIYNSNVFYKLNEFINEKYNDTFFFEWRMTNGPNWMECSNLPDKVKNKILFNIKNKTDQSTYNMIENEMLKKGNFDLFLKIDRKINNIRNEHWKDHNPELYDMLKKYIKES